MSREARVNPRGSGPPWLAVAGYAGGMAVLSLIPYEIITVGSPPNALDEGMADNDHPGATVLFEATHRPPPRLQAPMVGPQRDCWRTGRCNARPLAEAPQAPPATSPLGR